MESTIDALLAGNLTIDADDLVQAATLLADAEKSEEAKAFELLEFKPETFVSLSSPPSAVFSELTQNMKPIDEYETVFKTILKAGFGKNVKAGQRVLAQYEMFFENVYEPFDSTVLREKPGILKTGRGELLEGLEDAVLSMKIKEISKFIIKWQSAFGKHGCPPRIPAKANICCFVEIIKILDLPLTEDGGEIVKNEVSSSDIFETCETMLNEGKTMFIARKFGESIRKTKEAFHLLEKTALTSDEDQERMETLSVRINVNLAAMYNHGNKAEMACIHSKNALRINPTHQKALFNYGRASIRLSNFDVARKHLNLGLKHYPNDKSFVEELERLNIKEKDCAQRKNNSKNFKLFDN